MVTSEAEKILAVMQIRGFSYLHMHFEKFGYLAAMEGCVYCSSFSYVVYILASSGVYRNQSFYAHMHLPTFHQFSLVLIVLPL